MKIRADLMKEVYDALGSHHSLEVHDFRVTDKEYQKGRASLIVEYRHDTSCVFAFVVPTQRTSIRVRDSDESVYQYSCKVKPGYESTEEELIAAGRKELVAELRSWQNRVYEDLVSAPVLRQFQHFSTVLDKIEERLEALPDKPASDDEVVELRDALDRLKEEFSEQLAEQALDKKELKRRVETLENDILLLKETLETTTKRQWGSMFFTRYLKWRDTFSLRRIGTGARALSKALPQGVSEELDLVREVADGAADVIDELGIES